MNVPPCRRHPKYPVDDCPMCDREIERAESRDHPDDWQIGQERYEAYLDRIGGSE